MEEIAALPYGERRLVATHKRPDGFTFHTFRQPVMHRFTPALNAEHEAFTWAPLANPPKPLHPGVKAVLSKLDDAGVEQLDLPLSEEMGDAFLDRLAADAEFVESEHPRDESGKFGPGGAASASGSAASVSESQLSDKEKKEIADHLMQRHGITREVANQKVNSAYEKDPKAVKEGLTQLRAQKEGSIRRINTSANEEGGKINPGSFLWNKHDGYKETSISAHLSGGGNQNRQMVTLRVDDDGSWEMSSKASSQKPFTATGAGGEIDAMKHLPDFVKQAIIPELHSTSYLKRELEGFGPAQGGESFNFKTGKAGRMLSLPSHMHPDYTSATAQKKEQTQAGRNYLNVPYAEKDRAKAAGAKWDPDKKKWYHPGGELPEGLKRFVAKDGAPFAYDKRYDTYCDFTTDSMAFDRASVRTIDQDGRMHVERTHISAANVCPYFGSEILAGATEILNMDAAAIEPGKKYFLLRDPEELAKAASTFNNVPLLSDHVAVTADKPEQDLIIGSTGTDAEFKDGFLDNSIVIWTADAIEGVESKDKQEISCAYRYVADMTPGTYEGVRYDGVMRNLKANHVALVRRGRAGPDVVVGDSISTENETMPSKLSRKATMAKGALLAILAPKLAADKMPNLDAILDGVRHKNWLDKKPGILAAIKPKLGKDADLQGIVELLDRLDGESPNDDDMAIDSPYENILAMLRGKISDEDLAAVKAALEASSTGGAQDETPEQKAEREKAEADKEKAKMAGDKEQVAAPTKAAMDQAIADAVKRAKDEAQVAMDAAIKTASEKATKDALTLARDIAAAEDAIKPYCGKLAVAFDSAEAVYKAALDTLQIKTEGVHPSAYKAILEAQPKPNENVTRIAHDAKPAEGFKDRFPNAGRLSHA